MADHETRSRQQTRPTLASASGSEQRTEPGVSNSQLAAMVSGATQLTGAASTWAAQGVVFQRGMRGPALEEVQSLLGIDARSVDGDFGPATEARVKLFQTRAGLPASGQVDAATWAALQAQLEGSNGVLFGHSSNGASRATSQQDGLRSSGVAASESMAENDRDRVARYADLFRTVAARYDLPPALLAAITSRETRGGNSLGADGYSRYDGQGFGLMQVDKNSHTPRGGPRSEEHVDQAAQILLGMRDAVRRRHPDWSESQLLQGAVAAYNKGPRVSGVSTMDRGTTGGDYSADTWARARYYAQVMGGGLS